MTGSLDALIQELRTFARDRQWEQFHSPKNLACSVSIEAAELLEHFQWLTDAQSRSLSASQRDEVALEIADVLLYVLQLADTLDLDVIEQAQRKLAINAIKYPVNQARGTAKKYTQL